MGDRKIWEANISLSSIFRMKTPSWPRASLLTAKQLQPVVDQAISVWAGLAAGQHPAESLSRVDFQIYASDLSAEADFAFAEGHSWLWAIAVESRPNARPWRTVVVAPSFPTTRTVVQ
jgi:hypothetical protein